MNPNQLISGHGEIDLLLDATVGAGGHSEAFLKERGERARVYTDPAFLSLAKPMLRRLPAVPRPG